MPPINREIAEIFEAAAALLLLRGDDANRRIAYARAARRARELPRELHQIVAEGKLDGYRDVGHVVPEITEIVQTGKLALLDELAGEFPLSLVKLLGVDGMTARRARWLWQQHGISDIATLEVAARSGQLARWNGISAGEIEAILVDSHTQAHKTTPRMILGQALPLARDLCGVLRTLPDVVDAAIAGSTRRGCVLVNDIDLIATVADPAQALRVMFDFASRKHTWLVSRKGDTQITVETRGGYRVKLNVIPQENWGAALCYHTGSLRHVYRLQQIALDKRLYFDTDGLRRLDVPGVAGHIPCPTEESLYDALGLPWIPPELREDTGEIEAALSGNLPRLVTMGDIQGDLHLHSTYSDGKLSLRELAEEAFKRGRKYIAVTDHSQYAAVANGLSVERLMQQQDDVRRVDAEMGGKIRVLHGIELDIREDGVLDYPDEVLEKLDLVVASTHFHLDQSREQLTRRVLNAIQNPHVDIIGHPRMRRFMVQEAIDVDMEAVLAAAQAHQTALEINSNPDRLDLDGPLARRALEMGIKLAISTDTHELFMMDNMPFGVTTARRGWVTPGDTLNTWPLEKLEGWLRTRA